MSQASSAVTTVYAPQFGTAPAVPNPPSSNGARGNAGFLTLAAVAVIGVGALIFFTLKGKK